MDIRKVKKLIELLEESNISEIEIQEGEESVRISRHPNGASWQPQPMPQYAQHPGYAPAAPLQALPHQRPLLKQSLRAQATRARPLTHPW
ncbi:hypothetical protein HORIV_30210 [Vreelandella olivaria]|uniref:Acetyl-CoA carboxylase n=1 Tax=Vreelandella olivaria TaxID=390919 RepID=A0ABN5X0A5_9GAMM|nr:hypothetical protein HORIV_30210 [Halomonas olivaria]